MTAARQGSLHDRTPQRLPPRMPPPSPTSSPARPPVRPSPALHNQARSTCWSMPRGRKPDDVSLDVACGPGSVVLAFATRGARAASTQRQRCSNRRAAAATRRASPSRWHQGDVYALPFADAQFDIVSCRFAFHHLEKPARAFVEMARVARPGGRIVLCDAVASDDPPRPRRSTPWSGCVILDGGVPPARLPARAVCARGAAGAGGALLRRAVRAGDHRSAVFSGGTDRAALRGC